MITLKTYDRTPSLAELKVSYRRGKPKDDRQQKMPFVVSSPVTAEEYLRSIWDKDTIDLREEFVLVCLSASHEVRGWIKLSTGGIDFAPVDPRLVFAVALQTASAAIIVAHNHPGGDATPSEQDRAVTERLAEGAKILGLRLLDHVILTRDGSYSFSRDGTW